MTREEFQGHVVSVFSSAMNWRGENHLRWDHGSEHHYEVSWILGGMCGGNPVTRMNLERKSHTWSFTYL
jgi:hypothetical protein